MIEGDTLVAITIPQVDKVNDCFEDNDLYRNVNLSLHKMLDTYRLLAQARSNRIDDMEKEIDVHRQIEQNKDDMIDLKIKEVAQVKSKFGWLKLTRGIAVGALLVVSGMYIAK